MILRVREGSPNMGVGCESFSNNLQLLSSRTVHLLVAKKNVNWAADDSGPKISLGRNADQLVSLAGHQVHRENVANSRRVVLVLKRIGLQRRCFL
jgi:hypothetical protein